jgi:hypothetical protein
MMTQDTYNATQDHNEYQRLINTVEILNQTEYEFCKAWDAKETEYYLFNLGNGRWLNSNVYSEAEHQDHVYRMECGL